MYKSHHSTISDHLIQFEFTSTEILTFCFTLAKERKWLEDETLETLNKYVSSKHIQTFHTVSRFQSISNFLMDFFVKTVNQCNNEEKDEINLKHFIQSDKVLKILCTLCSKVKDVKELDNHHTWIRQVYKVLKILMHSK